jgi:hypothetical protein
MMTPGLGGQSIIEYWKIDKHIFSAEKVTKYQVSESGMQW